ncbi:MAG TPA: protein kinase [Gammaproteobacteria bacterium]
MALAAGTRLGIYEITGSLGAGGMGEVYRARDTKLGREAAIKTLPATLAGDKDRLARFEREAKLLAALNHAHIGAIYGLDEHEGTLYIAMELVEGETLEAKLKAGALPVEDALQLALQIAGALEAAHEKGVVHRDLKPANIMVLPNAQVKVLDFGLAKAFSGNPNEASPAHSPALSMAMTQQGLILGTAGYMSPEQASGQATDQRADVWAFGVVLYEMLTGLPLFRGESVPHILADVLRAPPDWTRLPKKLHPRVRQALERCLEKKPRNRYSGIADARVDIEAALADPTGGAVAALVSGKRAPAGGWLVFVGLAGATVATVAAVVVFALMPKPEPGPVVRFPFVLPEGQAFTRPEVSMIAISPDGTRLAYAASGQIYLRSLSETESRPLSGASAGGAGVAMPVFSPDGQWLAYVEVVNGTTSILKRVPISGGTPITLFEGGFPLSPSWPTPDTIVFAHQRGILRIPANGGAPEMLAARADGEVLGTPKILPGGDAVLFTRAAGEFGGAVFTDDTQIVVQTIGAEERAVIWDGGAAPTYLPTGHLIYAQGNTLFGIAFDADRRAVSGGPVPLVEGVRRSSNAFTDAAQYAVSASGTLVVIPGVGAAQLEATVLALVDRNGNVTPLDVPPARYQSPRVSPDGKRLAVEVIDASGEGHIWIYDLAGDSAIRRLTQTGNNTRPIWTPDGTNVTFGSERDGGWGIYEQSADGSRLAERLTMAEEGRRQFPDSWSPDGQTLAYTDADLGNAEWDLWIFSRASGNTELFAGGDANQFSAVFSPDGRWLAYTNSAGSFGIQVQPFPATGVVQQILQSGEAAPVWTAAGNELFFRRAANTGEPMQIMGLEIATAGGITFRNPRTLPIQGAVMTLGYRDFDITPDGERFVMIYPAEAATRAAPQPARIDVVLNWQQEVVARVPLP